MWVYDDVRWNSRLGNGEEDDAVFELLGLLLSPPVGVFHDTF
jgi:hypothetical protein